MCVMGLTFQWTDGRTTGRQEPVWRDCSSQHRSLTVQNMQMEPRPISFPGEMFFSIRGYSNRTIGSSKLILSIKREGRFFNLPIPCLYNIGSCTYPDMCTMLDQMINENWLGITRTLGQDIRQVLEGHGLNPSLCPQPPQVIDIRRGRIRLPEMPALLSWFAEGVYKARIRVIDNSNQEELSCLDVSLEVAQQTIQQAEECTGWFGCFFD